MVFICPHTECGRKFEEEGPMIEHVRRRHPEYMDKLESLLSKTIMSADKRKEEEIAKLPRLKLRPSQSKDKPKDTLPIITSKKLNTPAQIISNTRLEVKAMEAIDTAGKSKVLKLEQQRVASRGSLKEENTSAQSIGTSQLMTPKNDFRRNVLRRKSSKDVLQRVGSDDKKEQQDRLGTAATANDFSSVRPSELKDFSESATSSKLGGRIVLRNSEVTAAEKPVIRISKSKEKPKLQVASSTTGFHFKRPSSRSKLEHSTIQEPTVQPIVKTLSKDKSEVEPCFDPAALEPSSTVIIKNRMRSFVPPFTCIEYLSLNGCGLSAVFLEGLDLLREFSATHNQLYSMQFVVYEGNDSLTSIHLDNNQLTDLFLPRNIEVLTIAFNKIDNFDRMAPEIAKNSTLVELDLSFNPVKKLYNYKYELLLRGKNLKKVDGLKITKHDIDFALEYKSMVKREKQESAQKGTARYYDRFQQRIREDYSYAIAEKLTEEQYDKLRKQYESYTQRTAELQANVDIIETQNQLLEDELAAIRIGQSDSANIHIEYATLQAEVETMEMLNMLQFADEEELMQLIQAAEAKL